MANDLAPRVCFLEVGGQTLQLASVRYDGALKFIEQTETCWLGEPASLEAGVRKIMAGAETEPGVLLLRPAGSRGAWVRPAEAGVFDDEVSRAEWLQHLVEGGPSEWVVANSGEGLADLLPSAGLHDCLDRSQGCGIAVQRCQSAWLARVGLVARCLGGESGEVFYADLQAERVDLVRVVGGRVAAHRVVGMGLDSVIDAIQRELSLRFRSSATRLFHGGTYDFSDSADRALAPLAGALAVALAEFGPAEVRPRLLCGGLTSAQRWVGSALAKALGGIVPDIDPSLRRILQKGGVTWTEGAGVVDISRLGLWAAILTFDPRRPGESIDIWNDVLPATPRSLTPLINTAPPVITNVASAAPMRFMTAEKGPAQSAAPFAEAASLVGCPRGDGVRRMLGQILGGLAVAAGLALVAWLAMRPVQKGGKSAAADAARTVVVEANAKSRGNADLLISTWPAGASVLLEGLPTVKAPARFAELGQGRRTMTVSHPGYRTEVREVELRAGEVTDLGVLVLQRNTGGLALASRPTGLAFVLEPVGPADERQPISGVTPATLPEVIEGSYALLIRHEGGRDSRTELKIKAGETLEWAADLRTMAPGGEITVSAVTPEKVSLSWALPPGDYREFEIFLNNSARTAGRARVGKADAGANTFDFVIPPELARGQTYWFWVKAMLTNGNHGNIGPVAVRLE